MTMMRVLDFDYRGPPSLQLLLNPENLKKTNTQKSA